MARGRVHACQPKPLGLLRLDFERAARANRTARDRVRESYRQHVLIRDSVVRETCNRAEPEAMVEAGIAHEHAAGRPSGPERGQAGFDERGADSRALRVRQDRDRPEQKPGSLRVADACRRKGDVADAALVTYRDQRNLEFAGCSQGVDNQVLGLVTEGMIAKGLHVDVADVGDIACGFLTNHCLS